MASLTFNYPSMNRTGPGTASWTMLKFQVMLGYAPNLTWDFNIKKTIFPLATVTSQTFGYAFADWIDLLGVSGFHQGLAPRMHTVE